jgi:hypothetical protein
MTFFSSARRVKRAQSATGTPHTDKSPLGHFNGFTANARSARALLT